MTSEKDKQYSRNRTEEFRKSLQKKDLEQRKYINQAHELKFGESSYQNNFDESHLKYMDLKTTLNYIDDIQSIRDKKEIRKVLARINELTGNGAVGERIGRNGDYGGIRADTYKIAEYLSEAKNSNDKESLNLAKSIKESLLEKIANREEQMEKIETEYGPHIENYYKAAAIIGIAGGVLFLSPNLTGNVISNLSIKVTSFFGTGLLILGLIATFCLVKNKKK